MLHPWASHLQIGYKPHGCLITITYNSVHSCNFNLHDRADTFAITNKHEYAVHPALCLNVKDKLKFKQ